MYLTENAKRFIDDIETRCEGKYITDELIEIGMTSMAGGEIKEFNPKFKVSDSLQSYDVLRIKNSGLNPNVLFRTLQS